MLDAATVNQLFRKPAEGGDESAPLPGALDRPATQADADLLQQRYQPRLDALAKEGAAKFHFVDYSPPSFIVFQNKVYIQITLRNPESFDKTASSIYKRAAQTFDLFLGPQMKAILDLLPADATAAGLDITVLNSLTGKSDVKSTSSEAVEFICPLNALKQFGDAEITSQQLINKSIVLVNGTRIGLNLQLVE